MQRRAAFAILLTASAGFHWLNRPAAAAPVEAPASAPKFTLTHEQSVNTMTFGKNGLVLMTATDDKILHLWDMKTGKAAGTVDLLRDIYGLTAAPDQKNVAAIGLFDGIQLLNPSTGKPQQVIKPPNDNGYVDEAVAWSGDAQRLAVIVEESVITYDLATLKPISTIKQDQKQFPLLKRLALSANGKLAAVVGMDADAISSRVGVWDVDTGKLLQTYKVEYDDWVLFLDDKTLVIPWPMEIALFDIATGNPIRRFATTPQDFVTFGCAALSPDHQWIAGGTHEGAVYVWDIKTGKQLFKFTGQTKAVNALAFSPDGKLLASASDDKTVMVWALP